MDISEFKPALDILEEPLKGILEHILKNRDVDKRVKDCEKPFGVYPEGLTFVQIMDIKMSLNAKLKDEELLQKVENLIENNPEYQSIL